jgi:hypothetical protein
MPGLPTYSEGLPMTRLRLGLLTASLLLWAAHVWADDKTYKDENYKFSVTAPAGWQEVDSRRIRIPGELRRAWSPQPPTVIVIFVQKLNNRDAPDARVLLDRDATGLKDRLQVDIKTKEVRDVAGMKAAWLVYTGKGTGGSIDGQGSTLTYKHRVSIPRGQEVINFDLVTAESRAGQDSKVFEALLKSIKMDGEQTEKQKAAK